jgi:hypothetical protein
MAPGDIDETEVVLSNSATSDLADWASIWGDLMLTESLLESRQSLEESAPNAFVRRGLWEAALVAYARTVTSGRRRNMGELIANFTPEERRIHDIVVAWRNQHVAHRVDPDRESVAVRGVVGHGEPQILGVRVHVHPVFGPEEEDADLERAFQDLVYRVRLEIWESYMVPIKSNLIDEWVANWRDDAVVPAAEFRDSRGVSFDLDI